MRVQLEEGGTPQLRLNIYERPIANKYREGKMKEHPGEGSEQYLKSLKPKHWGVSYALVKG